ncbi:hypothetical protein [Bradyrhizobium sp. NBAIM02]|uniref:hypothetical protein n=1 Tax=Bradyrhizobium sp. NBAIM02 TaxID=2793817 RepID=UPI001CD7A831|nr:hypothetical protein [Bradyrhizobium sp. NBAIM02]MCA1503817.1 hypothetical protein [Bradyrhizobium sp. NBAIM02]
MSEQKNWFTVTISKINEGLNQDPYETFEGHTLSLGPDGTLSISGDGSRSFSTNARLYDGFEVKRLRVPTRD